MRVGEEEKKEELSDTNMPEASEEVPAVQESVVQDFPTLK